MNHARVAAAAVICAAISEFTHAYELRTHVFMTRSALTNLQSMNPSLEKQIGIDFTRQYGADYFSIDLSQSTAVIRPNRLLNNFEIDIGLRTVGLPPQASSLASWIETGAVREDDLSKTLCFGNDFGNLFSSEAQECNPPDDNDNITRVYNHFYDPLKGRGLVSSIANGAASPNWATGYVDAFASAPIPEPGTENHYSALHARYAMYRALTGTTTEGEVAAPDIRDAWWATTFRALGDMVHLVQDMAQPQHTKNESHPRQVFESLTDRRVSTLSRQYKIDGLIRPVPPLELNPLPPIGFDRYSDFWSTAKRDSIYGGSGLADVTHRNFLTPRTSNLNPSTVTDYNTPPRDPAQYRRVVIYPQDIGAGGPGYVNLLLYPSDETMIGYSRYATQATESILGVFTVRPSYTMSRFNYYDVADSLIPRGIQYSTGLLNYFFRGDIRCKVGLTIFGECFLQNFSDESMDGMVEVFYDDKNGVRRPVPNTRTRFIAPSQYDDPSYGVKLVIAIPPESVAPKVEGEFIVVFNGRMGNEGGTDPIGAVTARVIKPHRFFAAGVGDHALTHRDRGPLYSWGSNTNGQLGTGAYDIAPPYGAAGPVLPRNPETGLPYIDVRDFSGQAGFSLIARDDGSVWAWGSDYHGALGVSGTEYRGGISGRPLQVANVSNVTSVAAGGSFGMALTSDGSLFTWGDDSSGQRGDGNIVSAPDYAAPARIPVNGGIKAVAAGVLHGLALTANETVLSWGNNLYGQLGNGSTTPAGPVPTEIPGLGSIKAISAGSHHNLALDLDGRVWAWGLNNSGQLGTGVITDSSPFGVPRPVAVQIPSSVEIVAISAGEGHSMAIDRNGAVWTWGDNSKGQLGLGTTSSPVPLPTMTTLIGGKAMDLHAGRLFSVVMTDEGDVYTFGYNEYGTLALGTYDRAPHPIPVISFSLTGAVRQ